MSDTVIMDMDQETDDLAIPKEFMMDEVDENIMGFISSSDNDDEDTNDDEEDYLSQIENNAAVQEWCDKNKNTKNKKRKHNELNENETQNKYSDLMEMEQSTSGLNLDSIRESQLFREFRVIGLVCNDIPFCHQKLGDSFFIGTSIGKSFQIYEGKTLRLKISGRSTAHKINAIIIKNELTFTAVQSNVEIWYRVKKVGVITKHKGKVYIIKLMGHLLLTVGEDRMMYIWNIKRLLNRKFDISLILSKPNGGLLIKKPTKTIDFNADNNDYVNDNDVIECVCHPQTYLNKILIGYKSGKMQLWNINSLSHIYSFNNINIASPIRCIEASPILDVVGIGFNNGLIVIHNVKSDECIMKLSHFNSNNNNVGINGLSFRSDGIPYLVSVGSDRNIVIWDLKKRKLCNIYYNAHRSVIITARFIENENILLTSSTDNSLKMWIFDDSDGGGSCRLLRQRSGHSSAPHLCVFNGRKTLLSTSNDNTLRVSWIQRDIQCIELAQKHNKMRSQIGGIKCKLSNLITIHNNDNVVKLWNTASFKQNSMVLSPANDVSSVSTAIISHCGHFVYVGRISGVIDKYNIESGIHRLQISAHNKMIRSLHLSIFNNVLISTGGYDSLIKFWNVNNSKQQYVINHIANTSDTISNSCYDKRSNLLAVSTDNLLIYLFDAANGTLIRKFSLKSNISNIIFSPRCKWLLVSTMDGSVVVYDLMTGLIIDWFKFNNAVTSMSFAVNNTFLATTHSNTMGIHIWANKHHFMEPFLKNVGNKPIIMDKVHIDHDIDHIDDDDDDDSSSCSSSDTDSDVLIQNDDEDIIDLQEEIESLHLNGENNDLITMSSNPKSIWKNVANWDLILQRNKPSIKVKQNVLNIPFFIPKKMNININNKKEFKMNLNKELFDEFNTCSKLIYFIKKEFKDKNDNENHVNYENAIHYLLSLNPSASNAEIHCIAINIGTSKQELMLIIKFFIFELQTNTNFEHIQSFISLFLKVHSDLIIKYSKTLNFQITKLKQLIHQKWAKINDLFQSNLCLVQFYSHIQQ